MSKPSTKKLVTEIKAIEAKLAKHREAVKKLYEKKEKLEDQLAGVCTHPDSKVELASRGETDTLGNFKCTYYWWVCKQCKEETERLDWDRHQVNFSRGPIADNTYIAFTGRDRPKNKGIFF
jgi:hypothetical protein